MNDQVMLTIAIPTYGRPNQLRERLTELLPQINTNVRVEVFENGNSKEYQDVLNDFISKNITHNYSKRNQGTSRNIIRCFESCESEWIWILGDQDSISSDAVSRIQNLIKSSKADFYSFTYKTGCKENIITKISCTDDFIRAPAEWDPVLLSGTIYRSEILKKNIDIFIVGCYTWAPHFCVLIKILENSSGFGLVVEPALITKKLSGINHWSFLSYFEVRLQILNLFKTKTKENLAEFIWRSWEWIAVQSLREVEGTEDMLRWKLAFWNGFFYLRSYKKRNRVVLSWVKSILLFSFRRKTIENIWAAFSILPVNMSANLLKNYIRNNSITPRHTNRK